MSLIVLSGLRSNPGLHFCPCTIELCCRSPLLPEVAYYDALNTADNTTEMGSGFMFSALLGSFIEIKIDYRISTFYLMTVIKED